MKKLLPILISVLLLSSCGAGGGSTDQKSSAVVVDISPPIKVANPDCFDVEGLSNYPETFRGNYTIPTAQNKLPSNVIRSFDIKDLDAWFSKPLTNTCDDKNLYFQNLYSNIVSNLAKLNTERIYIINYSPWDNLGDVTLKLNEQNYIIPKNIMQLIVDVAKKYNIKVHSVWNIEYSDKVTGFHGTLSWDKIDKTLMLKLLDSFKIHIIDHAKFAQEIGLDGLRVDPGYFSLPVLRSDTEARELYTVKMVEIIEEVRKVYKGKLTYGEFWPILDYRILSKIDEINLYLMNAGHFKGEITYSALVQTANDQIANYKKLLNDNLKNQFIDIPVNWFVVAQSQKNFYTDGQWIEDGFCFSPCIQETLKTDFSLQAIAVDTALKAINQQTQFKTNSVSFTYWTRGEVVPVKVNQNIFTFPNISHSIRNKPSENIIKYWYSK